MSMNIEARLRRLETIRKLSMPMRAFSILAADEEDAGRQRAQAVADGRYSPAWPQIVVTGCPCPYGDRAMSLNLEARIARLENGRRTHQETHEDWARRMAAMPPMTEAERVEFDAEIEQEAIAEFGSLTAAAEAARAKANRTRNPLDGLLATDLECRVA